MYLPDKAVWADRFGRNGTGVYSATEGARPGFPDQ